MPPAPSTKKQAKKSSSSKKPAAKKSTKKPKIRLAINGFGRIGRSVFKLALEHHQIVVVAINDLGNLDNLMYLLQYDSAQGDEVYDVNIARSKKSFTIDGEKVIFTQESDPSKLPWEKNKIDVVVESTGVFTDYALAQKHLNAGAGHVVISAPAKGEPKKGIGAGTVLMGVNEELFQTCSITSNASCTTNAGSPVMAILSEELGVEKAMLTTVHGYTASQNLVDGPHRKDPRRGRAAAVNIIPTTTGAAKATAQALTHLKGKFDGMAVRVPVIAGSLADITFIASRDTTVDEVNAILANAAHEKRWEGIYTATEEPIVSSDIIGSTYASIADLSFTRVVGGNLVKVLAWYDNEMGYSSALVAHVTKAGKELFAKREEVIKIEKEKAERERERQRQRAEKEKLQREREKERAKLKKQKEAEKKKKVKTTAKKSTSKKKKSSSSKKK